jgi:Tfp pilus assembly protein PilF
LNDRREESKMALKIAIQMQKRGKLNKASKIFKYALSLDPRNPELLTSYGEYLELHKKDIVKA